VPVVGGEAVNDCPGFEIPRGTRTSRRLYPSAARPFPRFCRDSGKQVFSFPFYPLLSNGKAPAVDSPGPCRFYEESTLRGKRKDSCLPLRGKNVEKAVP